VNNMKEHLRVLLTILLLILALPALLVAAFVIFIVRV